MEIKRRIIKIYASLFVVVLLLPSFLRLVHHHEEHLLFCTAKKEKHFHNPSQECSVCHYIISSFYFEEDTNIDYLPKHVVAYQFLYRTTFILNTLAQHLFLRAPPFYYFF